MTPGGRSSWRVVGRARTSAQGRPDSLRRQPHRDAETARRAVVWSAFFGAFFACMLADVLGVPAGRAVGTSGTPAGILRAAMGPLSIPARAAVVVGSLTANVLNVYTGAISTLSLGIRIPHTWMAVLFALAGGALSWIAAGGFSRNFEDFLLLISYWVAPWIGVVLAWSIVHPRLPAQGPAIRRRLLWAFVVGVLTTIPFMNQTLYEGPLARWPDGAHIGYWVAFAVAFVWAQAVPRAKEPEARAHLD